MKREEGVIALTREVSDTIARCELTHLERQPIDLGRARAQHAAYERALEAAGCTVQRLPPLHEHADAVFVEDTALVLDEIAVLCRPGAESRRGEVQTVSEALAPLRPSCAIAAGTLDGGDVLRLGRRVYVGRSGRSDADGIRQLERLLAPLGYEVRPVDFAGCLHLKSAVTVVADGVLLGNRAFVDPAIFHADWLDVDPAEPLAGNALRVGDRVLHPAGFPRTTQRLRRAGLEVLTLPASELAKAEGGLTCCSLLIET